MKTRRTEEEMVAYALEIEPKLLPFAPELLADFDELGSDADAIVQAISGLNLPGDATVIDLGCGKGAVGIEIARQLGFRVTGIELFEPFIAICQNAAQEAGVDHRCQFKHGNIVALAGTLPLADIAVFAALGDVLGPLDETMRIIRQYVKPGGYVVISDCFVADGGRSDFAGFEAYAGRDQMLSRLTSWGDEIVVELMPPGEDGNAEAAAILERAQAIAQRHPHFGDQLMAYARAQADEYDFLAENMVEAIWVFRKPSGL
jgi:SAM-dependent methyltransferase